MQSRLLATALAILAVGSATLAGAQSAAAPSPTPSPIAVPSLPPSADPTTQSIIRAASGVINDILTRQRDRNANTVRGTVTYFKRYDMQVQTGTNAYRNVHLHHGTVINPRGATPGVGTNVDISGQGQSDGSIEANTITVLQ